MITTESGDVIITEQGQGIATETYEAPRGAAQNALDAFELHQSITIIRRTPTGTFAGGYTESAVGSVNGVFRLESSAERYFAGRTDNNRTAVAVVPFGTDVTVGDVVLYDGTRYRVLTVEDPAFTSDHIDAVCEELKE